MDLPYHGPSLALPWGHNHRTARLAAREHLSPRLKEIAVLDPQAAIVALNSDIAGLSAAEAERRLAEHGPNAVAREHHASALEQLAGQLWTPLNVMLLGLALVSYLLGDPRAAIVIAVMVVLSVGLSFLQEYRSSRAAEALRAIVKTTAAVRRRGGGATGPAAGAAEIPLDRIVPGDIVTLCAGDIVPADLRLIAAKDLFLNQAALTGEALPVEKFSEAAGAGLADAFEAANLCFMGTNVVSGAATGVVIFTGGETVFGHVAATLADERPLTSFEKGVNRFVWMMICFMLVMVPAVFIINGVTKGDWFEALLFAVAVAVGLTPEMLPMIVTVNLAKGALAMSRKEVIVKRLNSIQNFGAMDVLCTDKTGTLTQDRIILKLHLDLNGDDSDKVLEYAYLNSFHQSGLKNLLDVAVLQHTELRTDLCVEREFKKADEIPFDFQRRRMSVVLETSDGTHRLICKGAVEEVFAVCTAYEVKGETGKLDPTHFRAAQEETARLNADGFRVVAVAYKDITAPKAAYGVADESNLTLLGYIAFLDPPKDSARDAIKTLRDYHIRVKVLTGDNDIVTRKICNDVGVPTERIVLGREIDGLSPAALAELADKADVFAKMSPIQKAAVIHALHDRGHVVGFLGDGINDGPALRAADVGISVDTAVDIAKESADIILLKKSLDVLGAGVIEGRKVFGNITKYIKMGASSNFGNMFSVLGASIFLPFLPMMPIQVLTNNLLYDFSQTTIPTDNVDEEYLKEPRRWEIGNIVRFMLFIGPISSIFDYCTYFLMLYVFDAWSNPALFQTGWFVESILTQTLIIHVIRTARIPFIESRASASLIATTVIVVAIGMIIPFTALGPILGFVPLPPAYWPALLAMILGYVVLTHLVKSWFVRRWGMS
jgi:Mg2+-importing ATPase